MDLSKGITKTSLARIIKTQLQTEFNPIPAS